MLQKDDIGTSTIPLSMTASYPKDIELRFSLIDYYHRMRVLTVEELESTILMKIQISFRTLPSYTLQSPRYDVGVLSPEFHSPRLYR